MSDTTAPVDGPHPSSELESGSEEALPAVLCRAAADVIVDKGLGAFSLREVARRAGVSHAAPGYHFGDMRGLLTALATQGMSTLHREMAAVAAEEPDPIERLRVIGQAYVGVANRFPAHCEVIWREDLVDADDEAYAEVGMAAYGVLVETVEAIARAHNPDLVIDDAVKLCWSTMQGLVELRPKLARIDVGEDHGVVSIEDRVSRFTSLLVAGMIAGPHQPSSRS